MHFTQEALMHGSNFFMQSVWRPQNSGQLSVASGTSFAHSQMHAILRAIHREFWPRQDDQHDPHYKMPL